MFRLLFWICVVPVALYLLFVAGLYFGQRRMLYVPDRVMPDPVRAGVPDVLVKRIATADGLSLLAWYVPPAAPGGFTVLFLHGNAGNIAYRAGRLRAFKDVGWGALMLEYRGYGGNAGSPTEEGLVTDARAGLAELHRLGVPPERILLWGESLGTGVAVRLASENQVGALLLDSPYTSLVDVARRRYPYVPVRWLMKDRFDSLGRIRSVKAPILVMQGSADGLVPPTMGRTLIDAVAVPKMLWVAEGAGHIDLGPYGSVEAAAAFVRKNCPP